MGFRILLPIFLSACGSGGLYTNALPEESVSAGNAQVTRNAFIFGSDYPAKIVIPDVEGMRDTAFVVSTENPAGVVAIDLSSSPLSVSKKFKGLVIAEGMGYPRGPLIVQSQERAFCLTSSHLIDFNPATGEIRTAVSLLEPVALATSHPLSAPFDIDGDGKKETNVTEFTPSYPGGLALAGNTIFVSFSDYLQAMTPAVAAPGIIRSFTVYNSTLAADNATPIVTTDYNPTALVALPDGTVMVTNSGVNDIVDAKTVPRTDSGVDFINPATNAIAGHLSLGPVALSFQPPAISADGSTAFLFSASYGEAYAIDLDGRMLLSDHANPIVVTGTTVGGDYLSDGAIRGANDFLFVGSFTNSAVYAVDLHDAVPQVLPPEFPDPLFVGFPAGVTSENPSGVNTGIGAIAVRPGVPDVDYTGPDLFVLTGTPGTLVTINTRGSGGNPAPVEEARPDTSETQSQDPPPTSTGDDPPPVPRPASWQKPPYDGAAKPPHGDGTSGGTASSGDTSLPGSTAPSGSTSGSTSPGGSTGGSEPVILDDPPSDANAFADKIASFTQGTGGGYGKKEDVLGAPVGGTFSAPNNTSIYSLGCGGTIVLEMTDFWIADGAGTDFIVFENAMGCTDMKNIAWPEAAAVGVSNDGVNFVEFPCNPPPSQYQTCSSDGSAFKGCAGIHPTFSSPTNGIDPTDPAKAGGDAFDLATVQMQAARFVRIRDVSCANGSIGGYSAGFDLDAVAIVHGVVPK